MDEENKGKKTIIIVAIVIVLLLAGAVGVFLFMKKGDGTSLSNSIGGVHLFGDPAPDVTGGTITGGDGTGNGGNDGTSGTLTADDTEPVFKQLADKPVAGFFALTHDGAQFIRYVDRETGHIFEVNVRTGEQKQLTNTTVLRINEALWGLDGNAVVLRYLEEDPYTKADVIKSSLGYLSLPSGSSTDAIGSLLISTTDNLPDGITAASISPDGKRLFYMAPVEEGVSGSIVDLLTKNTKEVFRNAFTEWTPELLNNDEILLTTKPSANVPGHTYVYNIDTKTFERIMRNKSGLTTNGNALGQRILFAENTLHSLVFGVYDKKGFMNEGDINHESVLSLTTLPEKCTWRQDNVHMVCGAFSFTPTFPVPDTWYQGAQAFSDTFWSVNTDTNESIFLHDPTKEIKTDFDVILPALSQDEHYLGFINKNDSTLWRMKLPSNVEQSISDTTTPVLPPDLTPDELKDAQGTTPQP